MFDIGNMSMMTARRIPSGGLGQGFDQVQAHITVEAQRQGICKACFTSNFRDN